jgi:STE24 endopeptidase
MSIGLFWKDYMKKLLLLIIIGVPIFYFIMSLIEWGGQYFYVYVFVFVMGVFFLMLLLVPTCIMPMFNKYTPFDENAELYHEIKELSDNQEFPLKQILTMDASKRSAHSNAYFFGLCANKRIVLFDTLLKKGDDG